MKYILRKIVEMLIVLIIILIMMTKIIPIFQKTYEKTRNLVCEIKEYNERIENMKEE